MNPTTGQTVSAAPTPEIMDIEQLAAYTGICKSKLYDMITTYDGPPFVPFPGGKSGRCTRRFRKVAVDKWLEAREVRCAEDERRLMDTRRKPVV